jgi:hypothetical protein
LNEGIRERNDFVGTSETVLDHLTAKTEDQYGWTFTGVFLEFFCDFPEVN